MPRELIRVKRDYLKFWRIIQYWAKDKWSLSQKELDLLLFLYSEGYWSKDVFKEFKQLVSWDANLFEKMKQDGWISVFRKKVGNRRCLYHVSDRGRGVVKAIYQKLEGDHISETTAPMFKGGHAAKYQDKVYRNYIKKLNKEKKARLRAQPRRHSL